MVRAFRRLAVTFLVLAIVVGAVALRFLPDLAGWGTARWLEAAGYDRVHVVFSRVGLHSARIAEVRARRMRPERQLELALEDVRVEYRSLGLLAGRVESITVGGGRIETGPGKAGADTGFVPLVPLLEEAPELPFSRLQVEQLLLQWAPWGSYRISGSLGNAGDGLSLRARIEAGGAPLQAEALVGARHTRLVLGEGGRSWLQLRLKQDGPEAVTLQAAADIPVAGLLARPGPWQRLLPDGSDGRLELHLDGRLPREDPAAGSLEGRFGVQIAAGSLGRFEGVSAASEGSVLLRDRRFEVRFEEDSHASATATTADGESIALRLRTRHLSMVIPVSGAPGTPELAGHGSLLLDASRPRLEVSIRAEAPKLETAPLSLSADLHASGRWRRWEETAVAFDMEGDGRLADGKLDWELRPGSHALMQELPWGDARAEVRLTLSEPSRLRVSGGNWRATPAAVEIQAPPVQGGGVLLDHGATEARVESLQGQGTGDWNLAGRLRVHDVVARSGAGRSRRADLDGTFLADPQGISGEATVAGFGAKLLLQAKHSPRRGRGELAVTLPLVGFDPGEKPLSSFFRPWPYPFDIGRGALEGDWRLDWQVGGSGSTVTGRGRVRAAGIGGFYRDILFSGGGVEGDLALDSGVLWTRGPARVSLEQLTAGLPVSDIESGLALWLGGSGGPVIRLVEPSARLLSGRIHSEQVAFDFGQPTNRFTVAMEDIDIGRLLELEKAPLEATGRASGVLPIRIGPEGVTIEEGRLQVPAGGLIRYNGASETLASAAEGMGVAMQALTRFRYDSLDGRVELAPEGDLQLGVTVEGRNPELFDGRTIRFNINIEENVPALLRSLRAGDALTGQVENWLQDFHRRQTGR